MMQFIEVTDNASDAPMAVGLRFIRRIRRDPRDGCAVLEMDEGPRIYCKESYEQVKASLQWHAEPVL